MNALDLIISLLSFFFMLMSSLLIWAIKKFIDNIKDDVDILTKEIFQLITRIDVMSANFKNAHIDLRDVEKLTISNKNDIAKLRERLSIIESKH